MMKRTKVTDLLETSSWCAASSQQTQEEDITDFDPLDHPSLTLARLWPKFECCPIVCGRSVLLDAQFYPSVVRHFYCNLTWTNGHHGIELHSYFLGQHLKITRPLLARWIGVDLYDNKTYFVRGREFLELTALTHPFFHTEIVSAVCHTRDTPGGIKRGDLHPRLLILHLWICFNILPKKGHMDEVSPFEVYLLYCYVQGIKLDLPTIIMKEIVRIKEADGSKALGFGAVLTRVFDNTPILLEEELDEVFGGPLNHFSITQSKVLEIINARATQVDVNPDDVNKVVDELMNDARGNVNAPRQAFSTSMTPQLRGIATTQNLHERHITGLERDMHGIRGTTDRIERHLLGLPAEPVPPPIRPSRPRPHAHHGPDYDYDNASDSE
ncbi:hypothetical protein Dimus_024534 [Dionaea muscipula]